jgi:uncharacterized protein (TIGR00369 family)
MPLDPEIDKKVRAAFYAQAFMQTAGAEIHNVEFGQAEISAPLGDAFLQHNGVGHAGLTFALGDTAAGFAAATTMTLDGNVLTTEMKINLLAPATGQRLRAIGKVIKPGKRLIVTQADVYCETQGQDPVHIAILMGSMVAAYPKK